MNTFVCFLSRWYPNSSVAIVCAYWVQYLVPFHLLNMLSMRARVTSALKQGRGRGQAACSQTGWEAAVILEAEQIKSLFYILTVDRQPHYDGTLYVCSLEMTFKGLWRVECAANVLDSWAPPETLRSAPLCSALLPLAYYVRQTVMELGCRLPDPSLEITSEFSSSLGFHPITPPNWWESSCIYSLLLPTWNYRYYWEWTL